MKQSLKLNSLPPDLRSIADDLIADKFPETEEKFMSTIEEDYLAVTGVDVTTQPLTFESMFTTYNDARRMLGLDRL